MPLRGCCKFPLPFRNVKIDYFSPTPLLYNKNQNFNVVSVVYKAQRHFTAAFGNVTLLATSLHHNILCANWRCKTVVSSQRVRHIGMRLIESNTILREGLGNPILVSKICNIHDSASLVVDCNFWTIGWDSQVPPSMWWLIIFLILV